MFLTFFYAFATMMQWWRIKSLRDKINGTLTNENALIVATTTVFRRHKITRSIENLLFRHNHRIACTVVPKQKINLTQWISFPRNLRQFPIYIEDKSMKITSQNAVFIHLQALLDKYDRHHSSNIQVEDFGELIGWKVGDGFEIILKSNIDLLTKLILKFQKNHVDINHDLQLLKIETIDIEGNISNIKYEKNYLKEQTLKYSYAPVHWNSFVSEIKGLYAKLHDSTNPKIKIENGSTKSGENLLEVQSSKFKDKTLKKQDAIDKNTLEVKRHKHTTNSGSSSGGGVEKKEKRHKTSKTKDIVVPKLKIKNEAQSTTGGNSNIKDVDEMKLEISSVSNQEKVEASGTTDATKIIKSSNSDKGRTSPTKPPNVLVYADNKTTKDNLKRVLYGILNKQSYIIYDLPIITSKSSPTWTSNALLIVVCGMVPPEMTPLLIQYYLNGGQLLCLCSDLMYSILHNFTTAEVREHELVRFSYGDWQRVKMMHHIFCYQASPAKKQFSKDSDASSNHSSNGSSPLAPRTPSIVDLKYNDKDYSILVQVLGTEETWQTPSILLAKVKDSKGRAIFSQVHLEIDPEEYENDETKYESLKMSNEARLNILKDILRKHLEMTCDEYEEKIEYSPGYFLGRYDLKMEMLSQCENITNNHLTCDKINVVFYGNNVDPGISSSIRLPVLIHSCPSDFSTRDYFDTLITEQIGRLVIYANVLTSTQHVLEKKLRHGLVVIAKQQTSGVGRSNNIWLTPIGSTAFSLQVHLSMASNLGKHLSLIQHLFAVSVVSAIRNLPGYQDLSLGIKWPNDIYIDGTTKIGGLIVKTILYGDLAIVNAGIGLNLSNDKPTACLNDLIERYNRVNSTNIEPIRYEKYFAIVFNEFEKLFNQIQNSGVESFYDLYYKYWLHADAEITIQTEGEGGVEGEMKQGKVAGIDKYGFLLVKLNDGSVYSVQPDGNTFDMMKGLIIPKKF